ncbi:hypothetical protein CR156_08730 [Stenotrophomonas lactitubi]|uniref:hypothetical protein n=1 Tax=Stenotrophomonas TaxID=40323 RepID=UPI000C2736D6|nr:MULTISPECIES: hypothetical protein [Stenotrophomonas]MBD3682114.1 hypothetical protein [Stenotrophomonas sp. Br8]PJO52262.1 hypothetical protein CR156_08730 [Stenotrophomonas lactitubi]
MKTKTFELSLIGVVIATTIVFFAGAAAVWLMFGAAWTYGLDFGTGTRADWMAGVGTWAIGAGAIYYAHQTQLQREEEGRRARDRDRDARARRLDYMISKASLAKRQIKGFRALPEGLPEGGNTLETLAPKFRETKIAALEAAMNLVVWAAEDVATLRAADQARLENVLIAMIEVRQFMAWCRLEEFKGKVFFMAVEEALEKLTREATELEVCLLAEADRVMLE